MVTAAEFKRITVRIRFLKRYCNGCGIHPDDIKDTCFMHESLVRLTVGEIEAEKLNFVQITQAVTDLEALLGVLEIGMDTPHLSVFLEDSAL